MEGQKSPLDWARDCFVERVVRRILPSEAVRQVRPPDPAALTCRPAVGIILFTEAMMAGSHRGRLGRPERVA